MKREAVQEERQKHQSKNESLSPSPSTHRNLNEQQQNQHQQHNYDGGEVYELDDDDDDECDLNEDEKQTLDAIVNNESTFFGPVENATESEFNLELFIEFVENLFQVMPDWAKSLREFSELDIDDQTCLLKASKLDEISFTSSLFFVIV